MNSTVHPGDHHSIEEIPWRIKEQLIIGILRLKVWESPLELKLGHVRCNTFVSAKVPKEPSLLWQLLQNQGRPVFWHPGVATKC